MLFYTSRAASLLSTFRRRRRHRSPEKKKPIHRYLLKESTLSHDVGKISKTNNSLANDEQTD